MRVFLLFGECRNVCVGVADFFTAPFFCVCVVSIGFLTHLFAVRDKTCVFFWIVRGWDV